MRNDTTQEEESTWEVYRGFLGNQVLSKWHEWPISAVSDLKTLAPTQILLLEQNSHGRKPGNTSPQYIWTTRKKGMLCVCVCPLFRLAALRRAAPVSDMRQSFHSAALVFISCAIPERNTRNQGKSAVRFCVRSLRELLQLVFRCTSYYLSEIHLKFEIINECNSSGFVCICNTLTHAAPGASHESCF